MRGSTTRATLERSASGSGIRFRPIASPSEPLATAGGSSAGALIRRSLPATDTLRALTPDSLLRCTIRLAATGMAALSRTLARRAAARSCGRAATTPADDRAGCEAFLILPATMRTGCLSTARATVADFLLLEAETDFLLPILVVLAAAEAFEAIAFRPLPARVATREDPAGALDTRLPPVLVAEADTLLRLLVLLALPFLPVAFLAPACLAATACERAAWTVSTCATPPISIALTSSR